MAWLESKSGRSLTGELWRFLTIGTSNALVDFLVYLFLTRNYAFWQRHYLLANAITFTLANLNSFFWNRRWTFVVKFGNPWRQYMEFFLVSAVYLLFIQTGLWLLVERFGMYDLIAKVIVIGFGMLLYFTVLKKIVFWPRTKNTP